MDERSRMGTLPGHYGFHSWLRPRDGRRASIRHTTPSTRERGKAWHVDLAAGDLNDLQPLGQRHTTCALKPVVDLALGHRRVELAAELRLGDPVGFQVLGQRHDHIMVYFKTGRHVC